MAVPGFTPEELGVTVEQNLLVVRSFKQPAESGEYLYRGINGGQFERRFELADHLKVTGAELQNGMLTIDLVQELPEEMKPRRIELRSSQRQITGKPSAKAA